MFSDAPDEPNPPAETALIYQLRDESYPDPASWPECRKKLLLAAEWMDEAAVSTIHSFCNRMLSEHVANNALSSAREQGFGAVVCGHTHAPMDIERQGLRYFNTGSWTESPLHFLEVAPDNIILQTHEDGDG